MVDDVGAVDRSVQNRELFERINGGLDKERHETQLDAVASLELFLVSGTQRDDRAHVHFVEGGELRGTGKALNQTLCHTAAQTRHRNSILLAAVRIGRDRFGRSRRRSRPRSRNRSRRRFGSLRLNRRFSCRKRINLGNTVSRSSTDHGLGVNAGSGKNGGRRRHDTRFGNGFLYRCRRRSSARVGRSRSAHGSIGINHGDHFARNNRLTVLRSNFSKLACRRRRHFQHHLVGFDLNENFIGGYDVARLALPFQKRRFAHGFGEFGDFHLYGIHSCVLCVCFYSFCGGFALGSQHKTFDRGKSRIL